VRRAARRVVVGAAVAACLALVVAGPAEAHPLGNFSVNHLNALRFEADRIVNHAIVDTAEIPTAQVESTVDGDGDGTVTASELAGYGVAQCDALSQDQTLVVDGQVAPFAVIEASFTYQPGQAGLPTGRLECELSAAADLSVARTVEFSDDFEADRVGWHEITGIGDGARIIDSPVAQQSITDELRSYPVDLLSSPLDVRSATFSVAPGPGESTSAAPTSERISNDRVGPLSGAVDRINQSFNDLIGRRELTLGVGLLAVGLALLLGASHALLPGHGKTVMAAYIAGRQGSVRDAMVVGATVTGTHTGGVLMLGLALTVSSSLAGESVLAGLAVASGVIVAALGVGLLIDLVRHRGAGRPRLAHRHTHGYSFDDDHAHPHPHRHDHDGGDHGHHHHDHHHPHRDHHHGADHHHAEAAGSVVTLERVDHPNSWGQTGENGAITPRVGKIACDEAASPKPVSRRGLIGMGVAGGLVPSPSALVILLSAISLGRTAFGILLVIGYGLGMAATLTAAGILLVSLRDRYQRRTARRARRFANRWVALAPYGTATLVLVVGLGLAIRGLGMF
jgi:nickel/cobalt transporter (NicO) family protein